MTHKVIHSFSGRGLFKLSLSCAVHCMKRQLRFFSTLALLLILFALYTINWKLHYSPEIKSIEGNDINYDALCQLRYLRYAMEQKNAATEIQHIYPEGYVFFNALYGLSWSDLAETLDKNSMLYAEAYVEVQRAFNNINSEEGRIIFDSTLALPYGAFYNGWSTYLLGKKIQLESPSKRNPEDVKLFASRCQRIARVIDKQTYPETYYGSSWPADAVLCIAALSLHDDMFTNEYNEVIRGWLARVTERLDKFGLIPHQVHYLTGRPIENARGSSLSLMLCFLPEIDSKLSSSQFHKYYDHFLDGRLLLYGIREHAKGISAQEDIDSGPVVFGIGASASIVGIRAMRMHGHTNEAVALRNCIEAISLPSKREGRKKYLFGKIPIADVFIAWAQGPYQKENTNFITDVHWRTAFHLISLLISLLFLLLLFLIWKHELQKVFKKAIKKINRRQVS
jgi:hypothetical protein